MASKTTNLELNKLELGDSLDYILYNNNMDKIDTNINKYIIKMTAYDMGNKCETNFQDSTAKYENDQPGDYIEHTFENLPNGIHYVSISIMDIWNSNKYISTLSRIRSLDTLEYYTDSNDKKIKTSLPINNTKIDEAARNAMYIGRINQLNSTLSCNYDGGWIPLYKTGTGPSTEENLNIPKGGVLGTYDSVKHTFSLRIYRPFEDSYTHGQGGQATRKNQKFGKYPSDTGLSDEDLLGNHIIVSLIFSS